jgi:flagellar motor switch protein FliG
MSGRLADQLREDMEAAGKIRPADAEEAMSEVVDTIRQMEQSGDLLLIVEDEDEG